jgi:hypothetical protein
MGPYRRGLFPVKANHPETDRDFLDHLLLTEGSGFSLTR